MAVFLGALLVLYAVQAAFTGSVYAKAGASGRTVERAESPEYFWIVTTLYALVGVAFMVV